jgi:metal-responsive CopG/Arc/MetJ family transcriptional regulator
VYAGRMRQTDPEQRIPVPVRIRRRTLERIDALADERGVTRSDVLRDLMARGLAEIDRANHPARPVPKRG